MPALPELPMQQLNTLGVCFNPSSGYIMGIQQGMMTYACDYNTGEAGKQENCKFEAGIYLW